MEEKTLLAEIEKEKERQIKERFLANKEGGSQQKNENITMRTSINEKKQENKVNENKVNPFSSKSFSNDDYFKALSIKRKEEMDKKIEETTSSASNDSTIIERPNYDFIETLSPEQREKIFKEDKEKEDNISKPKSSKFKTIIISILFAILGVWGIVNIATVDSLSGQISEIDSEYNMNLISYLNNLHNLDATNSQNMENLFQTIPKDQVPPTTIGEESNWFDRFCNFIAGLFGG